MVHTGPSVNMSAMSSGEPVVWTPLLSRPVPHSGLATDSASTSHRPHSVSRHIGTGGAALGVIKRLVRDGPKRLCGAIVILFDPEYQVAALVIRQPPHLLEELLLVLLASTR